MTKKDQAYIAFLKQYKASGFLNIKDKYAHEGDIFMSLPLMILAVFSIFFGYITKDIFIGLGSGFFADNSIFIHPTHEIMLDTEFAVPTLFKLLPLIFTVSLSVTAIIYSEFSAKSIIRFKFTRLGYNLFGFFNQRFLIELFYNKYITGLILKLGGQTTKVLDKGSVELLGPYGLEKGLITLSRNIASLDTGVITSYALYIMIGLIFYILIPSLNIFDNSLLLLILLSLFGIVNRNIDSNNMSISDLTLKSSFLGNIFKNNKLKLYLQTLLSITCIKIMLGLSKLCYYNKYSTLMAGISISLTEITICEALILGILATFISEYIRNNIITLNTKTRSILMLFALAIFKVWLSGGFCPLSLENF